MKLLELHVRDYRSLVDVRLPLRNLTVMIGPNGAGKTALLETIQLLQQGSQLQLGDFIVDHGGIDSMINRGRNSHRPAKMSIGCSWMSRASDQISLWSTLLSCSVCSVVRRRE